MTAAEIKIELFRKIDTLKDDKLEEVYDLLINYFNNNQEIEHWDELSNKQKEAIQIGIDQLNNGKRRKHQDVMFNIKKKYLDE